MGYKGISIPLPLGENGLETDFSPSDIDPRSFIVANNITLEKNLVEKVGGSVRFNVTAIPSGVFGAFDWWPTTLLSDRKLICAGGDDKIYSVDDNGVVTEVTGPALSGLTNQTYFVTAGKEAAANNKKLFIFTGNNPVQIISGTAGVRTTITAPPADWSGTNQPSFGIFYKEHLIGGGNLNQPHRIYISSTTNHEDFTTTPLGVNVHPGQGDRLVDAFIYKGRLFLIKNPTGLYYLANPEDSASSWYFLEALNSFGAATSHSIVPILNDVLIKSANDSIISLAAVQEFGDVEASDTLSILKIEQYIRDNTNADGAATTHSIYYPEKKLAMFTYRSSVGTGNDRILMFRVDVKGKARATLITKDAPNVLALRKDSSGTDRPIYGSLDGYVYLMDDDDRNVNGAAYTGEFQTAHTDFGFADLKLAGLNKHFDFLELRYSPLGDWNAYADIFIDGNLYETLTVPLTGNDLLADVTPAPEDFMLAESAGDPEGSFLAGEDLLTIRKRLNGTGRTFSVRIYNSGLNESFKIAKMIVSLRPSGEQQR